MRTYLACAALVVATSLAANTACHDPNAGNIVTGDLSGPGSCVMAALLSGQINFSNPGQAALQLVSLCIGTTVTSILAMIEQLIASGAALADGGTDAGVMVGSVQVPVAQLSAVRDALKALPVGFSRADAIKALAAKK
jgi:hypothetical protein